MATGFIFKKSDGTVRTCDEISAHLFSLAAHKVTKVNFGQKDEESVEAVSDDTDDDDIETDDEEADASERGITSDSENRYMLASNPPSVDNSAVSTDYSTIDRFVYLPPLC